MSEAEAKQGVKISIYIFGIRGNFSIMYVQKGPPAVEIRVNKVHSVFIRKCSFEGSIVGLSHDAENRKS